MKNLLEETREKLEENGKTLEDIKWVGCEKFYVNIQDFIKLADVEYDNGYGGEEIATDLLVVGDNWWLERHEYDGFEWWEYKTLPTKPEKEEKIKALTSNQARKLYDGCFWGSSLAELNCLEDKYESEE